MRDVRDFFLIKGGAEVVDCRHGDALACVIEAALKPGLPLAVRVVVTNTGRARWLPSGADPGGVNLGCHLYDGDGKLLRFNHAWADLTADKRAIAPGETVETTMTLPPLEPGRYELEFDLVAASVGWFAQFGSKPARVEVPT